MSLSGLLEDETWQIASNNNYVLEIEKNDGYNKLFIKMYCRQKI
jgi:hypothetical protein